ncbi:MAG: enoyl-CoA hydratase-related protein [Symbiobacteriia bacterium]
MEYLNIIVELEPPIAVIQLNRPKALNALNSELMGEIASALSELASNPGIGAVVLTGDERAFAAGADIKEMAGAGAVEMLLRNQFVSWESVRNFPKPIIAAVSGYALGGGCELAMMCDMIVASETAQFGQPEINLGIIPGAGGTQRLTRAVGKARAMEMILTGRPMKAQEALSYGLVNRVVTKETYLEEAKGLAREIAGKAPIAVRLAKDSVLRAYDGSLQQGLDFERKNFYFLFASEDKSEGMTAFIEKRQPTWKGK